MVVYATSMLIVLYILINCWAYECDINHTQNKNINTYVYNCPWFIYFVMSCMTMMSLFKLRTFYTMVGTATKYVC